MNPFVRLLHFAILILLLSPPKSSRAEPFSQADLPLERAQELLQTLTPEEKVGQLFLVTFDGPEASNTSQVYSLVTEYHVGGVVLKASNDNFLAHDQTLIYLLTLTRQLQVSEYSFSQQDILDPVTGSLLQPAFIPLFIGISQEGDGYPTDQILSSSMTQLPSQMAVGATWNLELAGRVGEVLGYELSSLGINLLLGPSLDVLETPHPDGQGDLGIRTFGGSPFWVGEMGRAFVGGLHRGSNNKIVVIARHFPGSGNSTRLPEEEVATVPKSLDQLKQVELPPFYAVTGNAPSPETTVDGLLTAHIRYQALPGINKPVSLDPEAFDALMKLEPIAAWRGNGGLMVSDELGGPAIRRFYEANGLSFTSRFVARDAFQAGNDLLYLGNFISAEDPDSYTSVIRTLEFFIQKYREDDFFAKRVDASVLRILTQKFRLYGDPFTLGKAQARPNIPNDLGKSGEIISEVIQQAAALMSPAPEDLINTLPSPPGRNDRIVFITDVRFGRQCSKCPLQSVVRKDALEQSIVRLYSTQAGGEILSGNLVSYTYEELQELLDVGSGIVQIENDLKAANWVVFLMLDENPTVPSSYAMRRLFAERPDLLQQKKLVGFALNAPYFLDATDVSRLNAYYALHSKTQRSFDVAARLLMQEARLTGALPVSVPGVGYDLNQHLLPNPENPLILELDVEDNGTPTPQATTVNGSPPSYKVGDTIPLRTGAIMDHNGHPVPDGTSVSFLVAYGEGGSERQVAAVTDKGIARATIRVEQSGMMLIQAESGSARSERLQFDVLSETGEVVEPTATQAPTITPTVTPTVTVTPTLTPTPVPIEEPRSQTNLTEWFLALGIALGLGLFIYWTSSLMGQVRWGVRGGFLALIGGLLAYCYLAAGMPGSVLLVQQAGTLGVALAILCGVGIGWIVSVGWRTLQRRRAS